MYSCIILFCVRFVEAIRWTCLSSGSTSDSSWRAQAGRMAPPPPVPPAMSAGSPSHVSRFPESQIQNLRQRFEVKVPKKKS